MMRAQAPNHSFLLLENMRNLIKKWRKNNIKFKLLNREQLQVDDVTARLSRSFVTRIIVEMDITTLLKKDI